MGSEMMRLLESKKGPMMRPEMMGLGPEMVGLMESGIRSTRELLESEMRSTRELMESEMMRLGSEMMESGMG